MCTPYPEQSGRPAFGHLTNAILLPPGAAVVELIPTRDEIINHFDDELSSKCGYTMFWYLAASR